MNSANFHGEVIIKRIKGTIPEGAKKINPINGQYKIGDSEATGNFHLLEDKNSVDVYEKDGILYVKTLECVKASCVDKSRHDTQVIEPTKEDEILVIEPAQEYDYLSEEIRRVED